MVNIGNGENGNLTKMKFPKLFSWKSKNSVPKFTAMRKEGRTARRQERKTHRCSDGRKEGRTDRCSDGWKEGKQDG